MLRRKSRVYWRKRGSPPRAYGDFRDYKDVGGGLEALIPPECKRATTDLEIAERLAADRLTELQVARRKRVTLGVRRNAHLKEFADEHLDAKGETEDISPAWAIQTRCQLDVAIDYFGAERELTSIRVADVREYVAWLRRQPNGRDGTFSEGTVRHYLNSLSNLFRRAVAEEVVLQNPVASLMHKPTAEAKEADWLEVSEGAELLEAAKKYEAVAGKEIKSGAASFPHAMIATFLLTGGRRSEVLGLRVSDVNLDRGTITFRPNQFRRLKTRGSRRTIPLWPQLSPILRRHLGAEGIDELVFPSSRRGASMITSARKTLDNVGEIGGFERGRIRTKIFRHTYCSARLQTLDHGAPVALFTVARELGHSSTRMVERVYSHLGRVRHRSEVVEYG